jgi:hypothetical protein
MPILRNDHAQDHQAGEQPTPEQHRPGVEMDQPWKKPAELWATVERMISGTP